MSLQLIIIGLVFIGIGILGIKLKRPPFFGEFGKVVRIIGIVGAFIMGSLLLLLGLIFYIF